MESGAEKDEDKIHLNVHMVKQKNKAKPSMPRHVVQHSEPDVLSVTLSYFMTVKKSASVTGNILIDNGHSLVVVEGHPEDILTVVELLMGLVVTRLSLSVSDLVWTAAS